MSCAPSSVLPKEPTNVEEAVAQLQAGPTVSRPTYRLIQMLRAVAALMVVAHHSTIMLTERVHLPVGDWVAGSSGVDIFFVISGFVMTISSEPLRRATHPARTFLARRLERIIPLYWLVTTVKVLLLLLVPALGLSALGAWPHILKSYLFLPSVSTEFRLEPVVVVGWTLNFEMAFYALFCLPLALRQRSLWWLAPVLLLVPLIPVPWMMHLRYPYWFYRSTQTWEFLMGMVLGSAVPWVRRVPWGIGLPLLLVAFVPLLTINEYGVVYNRGLLWGIPAAAVVFGAISMEHRWGARSPRWALELGDASYSIYLIHTFTLPALGIWLTHWPHRWPNEVPIAMAVCLALSALAGEAVYRTVELPISRWLKGRRRTAVPANA